MPIAAAARRALAACLPLLLAAAVAAAPAPAESAKGNWPRWRGPDGDGVSSATGLPTTWWTDKNVAWKLDLPGRSGATPALWGDRMFLTAEDLDNKQIVLMCVSTGGKELWRKKLSANTGRTRFMGQEGENASPSPSTDGKHVWAFCGTGELACFDVDGKEVWNFNVQDRYGKYGAQHGLHNTPLLDGDRLYLEYFVRQTAYVVALDKTTGKEVWKVERKSDGTGENLDSYTSPVIWRNGKDAYLITHGNDYAIAHSLADGSEIWRVGGLNPKGAAYRRDLRFVSSPVATPDLIVIPSAKDHGVVGLKPDAKGTVMPGSDAELWRLPKGTPDVSSPLVYDGLVYLCRDGSLLCLEAKTGKKVYEERIHADRYRASPVGAGGNVYLTSHDGTVTVVKAGPKFEKVAENKLNEDMTASPVIGNRQIYLRGWKALYAIGSPSK